MKYFVLIVKQARCQMKISIEDKVKVIDQEITGTVVEDWGKTVVIIDDDAETLDDRLEFRISDLELIEEISDETII